MNNNNFMREALDLARQGRALASPNPMVGAVVVRDGAVVGRGFYTWAGVRHAEVIALAEAGAQARGATVYVSLEPCSHQGRTPPCADALIEAGVARVVAAHARIRIRWCRAKASASCAMRASRSRSPPSTPPKRKSSTSRSSISCGPAARW